jgi:hypothetical protein
MATQPPGNFSLPLLYKDLVPLSSQQHGKLNLRRDMSIEDAGKVHAIPVTIEEFAHAQRNYPIIFSAGETPVPLALMGLSEGVNTFLDDKGVPIDAAIYMPAYLRRYPFMLVRLRPESDELSLCYDPASGSLTGGEGEAMFDGDQPSELTTKILDFCEQFETAGQRTHAFVEELMRADLLMEGEVSIQLDNVEQPFVYRGFRMINEEKLRDLRGDELRKLNQNGALALIYAHLMSLGLIRDVFYRQVQQGKGPIAADQIPTLGGAASGEATKKVAKGKAKTDAEA